MTQTTLDLTETGPEYLCRRLREHRRPVTLTGTDPVAILLVLRAAIIASGLDATIIGRAPNAKPETYAQCFERLFGEPLYPKKTQGRTRS